jgi:hypothetical protein
LLNHAVSIADADEVEETKTRTNAGVPPLRYAPVGMTVVGEGVG